MQYVLRVVEDNFTGTSTYYVGPLVTEEDARIFGDAVWSRHDGEADVYIEELHPHE